jgi:hypothetical protein
MLVAAGKDAVVRDVCQKALSPMVVALGKDVVTKDVR